MAQAATGTETTRDEDSAMNELQMLEIIWLLLKLVCFMLGLLAGMLLGHAMVWRPLDRALQAELIWQSALCRSSRAVGISATAVRHLLGCDLAGCVVASATVNHSIGGAPCSLTC